MHMISDLVGDLPDLVQLFHSIRCSITLVLLFDLHALQREASYTCRVLFVGFSGGCWSLCFLVFLLFGGFDFLLVLVVFDSPSLLPEAAEKMLNQSLSHTGAERVLCQRLFRPAAESVFMSSIRIEALSQRLGD